VIFAVKRLRYIVSLIGIKRLFMNDPTKRMDNLLE
jgi:hypothetical protein